MKNSINRCKEIILNVSFIRDSGLKLLIPELQKAKAAGKNIKILTSDYMKGTEPNVLYRLLDIPGVKILIPLLTNYFIQKHIYLKIKTRLKSMLYLLIYHILD